MIIIITNYNVSEIFQKTILESTYFAIDVLKACSVILGHHFTLPWYSELDALGI